MTTAERLLYEIILRRDRRYDGRFLTGVRTTGIYCLPSCAARKPKFEHVLFYKTPEDAVAAGFRACYRCQPDAFYNGINDDLNTYRALMREMEITPENFSQVADFCARSNFSRTKIKQLFRDCGNISPGEALREARLRAATMLLVESARKVTEIAYSVGFRSEGTFRRLFVQKYGVAPNAYRSKAGPLERTRRAGRINLAE